MGISWSSSRNGLGRTLIHSSNQNQPPSQFSDWTPPPMEIPGSSSCSGLRRRRIHSSNQNQYASQLTNWTPPPPPPLPPPPMEIPGSSSSSGLRRIVHSSHQNQHPSQLNDSSPLSPPPEPMFRDYVNVRKRTLRLEVDEQNPDHLLISFVFDALFDGRFTIFYFVKEEPNCKFLPIIPEAYVPVKVPFQKGSGQKFRQPSGTGIDLVFLELEELSTPSPQEGFFPLVISAETFAPADPIGERLTDPSPSSSLCTHITQAVIHKNNENVFDVRVFKQLLWIFRARYELYDTYRIANSTAESFRDEDPGQVCVICLTEPVDTRVFPCGHMCMCGECAEEFRFQANKCPLCRQPATKVFVPVEAIRSGFV